jgi:hypothetical protein
VRVVYLEAAGIPLRPGGDAGQAVKPAIELISDFGAESDGGGRTLLAQSRCQRRYAPMVFGFISE